MISLAMAGNPLPWGPHLYTSAFSKCFNIGLIHHMYSEEALDLIYIKVESTVSGLIHCLGRLSGALGSMINRFHPIKSLSSAHFWYRTMRGTKNL